MGRRALRGGPAADAASDEIKLSKFQSVENFEVVKNHIFDRVDIFVLVALSAAGMRRGNHPRLFCQTFVKWQPTLLHAVHIGKAMQINQRRSAAVFENPNFAPVDLDTPPAQWSASAGCSILTPGNCC